MSESPNSRTMPMTRILVLLPHSIAEDAPDVSAWPRRLGRGSALVYRPVRCPTSPAGGFFDGGLEDLLVFHGGCQAAEEGIDAVCTMTLDDGGAAALRSVLDLPVLAAGKTASLHAMTLASNFAWVVETDAQAARLRAALRQWHLAAHCVSVRVARPDTPHALRAALVDCVETDGAAAICLGGPALVAAARTFVDAPGVPVLDPLSIACHMADALLALNLTHSRTAAPRPLVPKPAVMRSMAEAMAAHPSHHAPT